MTREEAIRFGKTILMLTNKELESDKHTYEFTAMAIKALENQPKFIIHSDGTIKQIIEPFIRPKGEWIGNENGRCSVCGHRGCGSDIWDGCKDGMFCPNCGADLRGEV